MTFPATLIHRQDSAGPGRTFWTGGVPLSYLKALKEVEDPGPRPIYVLHGGDGFLQSQMVTALKSRLVPPGMEGFSFHQVEGEEGSLEETIQVCRTPVFMGGHRLVVVENHPVFESASKDRSEEDLLLAYAQRPARESCLVFRMKGKPDGRRRLFKELAPFLVDCSDLSGPELEIWLKRLLSQGDYRMEPDARGQLLALVGHSTSLLAQETGKLMAYAGREKLITSDHVDQVAAGLPQETVFRLLDFICEGNAGRALEVLSELRQKGEPAQVVLFMLARQFRLIRLAGEMLREKKQPAQMARELGQHPFVMKKCASQWRRFQRDRLVRGLSLILTADYRIKTGRVSEDLAMERLVVDLAAL